MKAVTFYLIMFCDFKFVLWINCEAELIREEKQIKTPQSAAFWIVCMFHAGCGVKASPGLVELKITRLLSPRYHAAQRCG
ncbi:hypothetical protein DNR33_22240 [Escherichia coli]|uniref:Uncharacterized protein n=6 Tax=Enterobacteriaceae TaxID=543 RepID=A0A7Z1D4B8_SHISO|nr:hypothetical protein CNQ53_18830 [Escherichia coli]KDW70286.1 hypothetical protein AB14_4721 [Escherichia coli 1-392-07_S1_C1]OYE54609.1 hypothetical protein CI633_07485 [Shigella sonnei]OYK76769.1 hypothetical protein CI719_08315 [Shigella boydii]CDK47371.1 hypothetical protein [Escherichia coli IS1]